MIEVKQDALRAASTIALAARAMEHSVRQHDPDGLSLLELTVLRQVERGNALPSGIARAVRVDPARVTRIADRLVGLALLERGEDASDRRRCLLRMTDAGRERLARGRDDLARWMDGLVAGLSVQERDGLAGGLEALRRELDAAAGD